MRRKLISAAIIIIAVLLIWFVWREYQKVCCALPVPQPNESQQEVTGTTELSEAGSPSYTQHGTASFIIDNTVKYDYG